MKNPGIYPDVSMAEYLAMPAVSASILHAMLERCPKAAWFESWLNPGRLARDSTDSQDAGSIAHSILLDGHSDGVEVIDPNDYPTKSTGNIPDGWTNKDIRVARDDARAAGKIPVLAGDMVMIEAMVAEARRFLDEAKAKQPAIWKLFQPGGGQSEVTMVWDEDGTLCRIRPDRINPEHRLIVDYKTGKTTAEPDTWGRVQMIRMGYYVSAAFYRRGVEALTGVSPDYSYLVQEQDPPYLCSLVGMGPHHFALGGDKIEMALAMWADCAASNRWPGYPADVCYPELPNYEDTRWMEKREASRLPVAATNDHYATLFGGMQK